MEERHGIVVRLAVGAVFCPDTCPVDTAVIEQLDNTPWLHKTATAGNGCIYTVVSAF